MQQGMPCGSGCTQELQAAMGRCHPRREAGPDLHTKGQLGAAVLEEQGSVRGKRGMQACKPKAKESQQTTRLHLGHEPRAKRAAGLEGLIQGWQG